jgi:hypothetical protein
VASYEEKFVIAALNRVNTHDGRSVDAAKRVSAIDAIFAWSSGHR